MHLILDIKVTIKHKPAVASIVNSHSSKLSMKRAKSSHPHNYYHLVSLAFCVFVISLFVSSSSHEEEQVKVGYGYTVRSVGTSTTDSSGMSSTLTAHLQLIKNSSLLGPDIQNLNLLARYLIHLLSGIFVIFLKVNCLIILSVQKVSTNWFCWLCF